MFYSLGGIAFPPNYCHPNCFCLEGFFWIVVKPRCFPQPSLLQPGPGESHLFLEKASLCFITCTWGHVTFVTVVLLQCFAWGHVTTETRSYLSAEPGSSLSLQEHRIIHPHTVGVAEHPLCTIHCARCWDRATGSIWSLL